MTTYTYWISVRDRSYDALDLGLIDPADRGDRAAFDAAGLAGGIPVDELAAAWTETLQLRRRIRAMERALHGAT